MFHLQSKKHVLLTEKTINILYSLIFAFWTENRMKYKLQYLFLLYFMKSEKKSLSGIHALMWHKHTHTHIFFFLGFWWNEVWTLVMPMDSVTIVKVLNVLASQISLALLLCQGYAENYLFFVWNTFNAFVNWGYSLTWCP